jgi:hypothetical protein
LTTSAGEQCKTLAKGLPLQPGSSPAKETVLQPHYTTPALRLHYVCIADKAAHNPPTPV